MKGLKCLHVCHGRPLHPVLRDLNVKSYSWTSSLAEKDAGKDWKNAQILFLNFRSLGNNCEKVLHRVQEIISRLPDDKKPYIIPIAEDFTGKELECFKDKEVYDFLDLEPIATLAERAECLIRRYDFIIKQEKNYRRLSDEIDSLKTNNKDLKRLTLLDDLTGLHNTRYMKEIFLGLFALVERYSRPLAVLMLDVDHFKDVNDKNDHLVGSTVLKEVGRILKEYTRQSDIRIRYGGDEFVVLMPETNPEAAEVVAERIRTKIEELAMTVTPDCIVKVTASLGVANFVKGRHSEYWQLLREADIAMYQAKEGGRNRVAYYQGDDIVGYDAMKSSFATVLKQILEVDGESHKKTPLELDRYLNLIKKGELD